MILFPSNFTNFRLNENDRLRAHCSEDAMGQSGDHLLRRFGHSADAAVSGQHRRRHGPLVPLPLLEGLLLRLHAQTQKIATPPHAHPPLHRREALQVSMFFTDSTIYVKTS